MSRLANFTDWLVRDKDGNVVIGQAANLPIKMTIAAGLLALVTRGPFRLAFGLVTFGALFTWAWLEIFDGTTPLRRIMGGFVMAGLLGATTYFLAVVLEM